MERIIKLAIEGGYIQIIKSTVIDFEIRLPTAKETVEWQKFREEFIRAKMFLDPFFWQALGKAMRWDKQQVIYNYGSGQAEAVISDNEPWFDVWHRFVDHLASGKDPESFFTELLKGKEE